jgi:hypothetical protein
MLHGHSDMRLDPLIQALYNGPAKFQVLQKVMRTGMGGGYHGR